MKQFKLSVTHLESKLLLVSGNDISITQILKQNICVLKSLKYMA